MKITNKSNILIILLIMANLLLVACNKEVNEPQINIQCKIIPISDNQYQEIGTTGLVEPLKEDFKEFKFVLKVEGLNGIKDRKIIVPDFNRVFNEYENNLYWYGNHWIQDNNNENIAEYSYDIILYTHGFNQDTLRKLLNSNDVIISWINNGHLKEYRYKIGDLVKFQ